MLVISIWNTVRFALREVLTILSNNATLIIGTECTVSNVSSYSAFCNLRSPSLFGEAMWNGIWFTHLSYRAVYRDTYQRLVQNHVDKKFHEAKFGTHTASLLTVKTRVLGTSAPVFCLLLNSTKYAESLSTVLHTNSSICKRLISLCTIDLEVHIAIPQRRISHNRHFSLLY
jgi:hypothetical protein